MRHLALVVLLLAPLAPVAHAQVAERLANLRLATAVRIALVDDVRTRALDLNVSAQRGEVRIEGEVPSAERRTVAEVTQRVPGVRRVEGLGTLAEPPAGPVVTVSDRPAEPTRQSGQQEREAGPVYHTVQRGDTLFSLARRYETTVEAILDLNGRQSTNIQEGQRLRVR